MDTRVQRFDRLSLLLLAAPLSFLGAVLLKEGLGIGVPFDWVDAYYSDPAYWLLHDLLDLLVVAGPLAALALLLAGLLRIELRPDAESLLRVTLVRSARWRYVVLIVALGAATILIGYGIAENLPCLLGQRVSC